MEEVALARKPSPAGMRAAAGTPTARGLWPQVDRPVAAFEEAGAGDGDGGLIGAGGFPARRRGEALGLALVVDGFGLALQGLLAGFVSGEAFLEISHREGVIGLIRGGEPCNELGDPAGFGLAFSAQLPEGGPARGFLRRGADRKGDRPGAEQWSGGEEGPKGPDAQTPA
jgi:hypothetical protein